MSGKQPSSLLSSMQLPASVTCAYLGFGAVGFTLFHMVAEREASSVLTLSALAECLGIVFLVIQSFSSGSAAGISAGSLILEACALSFKLCSTLWLDGYLPSDRSGDFIYQSIDVCSLLLLVFLIHRVLVTQRESYQATEDTMRCLPILSLCVGLAALLHGDMDDSRIFDTLWLAGLFTSVVAVLPQFWLIMSSGGWAGAMTSHYIAAMALSRILSGLFMWMARFFITCDVYVEGVQHTIISIFIAHFVHAVLLADFALIYARSVLRTGVCEPLRISFEV
jgi:hypothetical protein